MGGLPEPCLSVMGRLQAEKALVPIGIVEEANVFDPEFLLSRLPFLRPGQMRFVKLLTQLGNLDLVRNGKNNSKHGDPASWSDHHCQIIANRNDFQLATDGGVSKTRHRSAPAMLKAFFA